MGTIIKILLKLWFFELKWNILKFWKEKHLFTQENIRISFFFEIYRDFEKINVFFFKKHKKSGTNKKNVFAVVLTLKPHVVPFLFENLTKSGENGFFMAENLWKILKRNGENFWKLGKNPEKILKNPEFSKIK